MQQNPPHSPGVVDIIAGARTSLQDTYLRRFSGELYGDFELRSSDGDRMSVGPVRGEVREVVDLAKPLYTWTIESMSIAAIRAPLKAAKVTFDPQAKQIVLLRTVLIRIVDMPEPDARALVAPLEVLNGLRVAAAHALPAEINDHYHRLDVTGMPATTRAAWTLLVNHVAEALNKIAGALC